MGAPGIGVPMHLLSTYSSYNSVNHMHNTQYHFLPLEMGAPIIMQLHGK